MNNDDYSIDELLIACIAHRITDGQIVAQGIATPLVTAGYLLAKCIHAPNLRIASAIGQGVCDTYDGSALGVARIEDLWLGQALMTLGFVSAAADVLPTLHPLEFFRPGQVDLYGNFNNIAFGSDYQHPRLRLPGVGGIPDVTITGHAVHLYVTRHSRVTFVEKCDYISGLGHSAARTQGAGPRYLISDLGQFDWVEGVMRLTHLHPGVTVERVRAKTGFDLTVAPDVGETRPPTAEELRLLREVIDPLGVRELEMLGGAARRDKLRAILAAEGAL
jgi:acyl CoA:acetate/3-ketoacid CoA transferase beta subunit